MSRSERRAERIKSEVPIEQVLNWYGYDVMVGGGSREQQFRCDLHGDGSDNKPSARCYPETNQWYCWACGRSRDAIQTVREKEGMAFHAALDALEQRYGLPALPWDEGDDDTTPADPVAAVLDAPHADPVRVRTERVLEDQGDTGPMRSLLTALLRPRA